VIGLGGGRGNTVLLDIFGGPSARSQFTLSA